MKKRFKHDLTCFLAIDSLRESFEEENKKNICWPIFAIIAAFVWDGPILYVYVYNRSW